MCRRSTAHSPSSAFSTIFNTLVRICGCRQFSDSLGHRLGFLVQKAGTCWDWAPGICCLEELLVHTVPGVAECKKVRWYLRVPAPRTWVSRAIPTWCSLGLLWRRRGSVLCYREVVPTAAMHLFWKHNLTQNILKTLLKGLLTEVWLGLSELTRDAEVSKPSSSGKTLQFLGLWDMGRKCYRIPARARTTKKGLFSGVLVNI